MRAYKQFFAHGREIFQSKELLSPAYLFPLFIRITRVTYKPRELFSRAGKRSENFASPSNADLT
jgi:hypothetical protein